MEQDPKIRFYAGAPLIVDNGHRIGTFCLIDRTPRTLNNWEIRHLRDIAKVVSLEIQGIDAAQDFVRQNQLPH